MPSSDPSPTSPPNPFAPAAPIEATGAKDESGRVFGNAKLIRSGFLYRVIDLRVPRTAESLQLTYTGWWFLQRVYIDGMLAWWKISWLTIQREIHFPIPPSVRPIGEQVDIEITFGPGLMIRRFRIWLDGSIAFDQIH